MVPILRQCRDKEIFRAVAIFDPHFAAHNPAAYKVDYWPLLQQTLDQVFRFANQKKVDAIFWAGDIFHSKSPARNPLWFMKEAMDVMAIPGKVLDIPNLGIAGNHDLKFGSLLGLKGQPLDILITAGLYHLLDKDEWLFSGDGFSVLVAGASYDHGTADNAIKKQKQGASWLLTLGHFWFGPHSTSFYGEPVTGPDKLGKGETDAFFIGHHHDDQGVCTVLNTQYDSHGSITRTGAHQQDLKRRPAASYVEVSKQGIKITLLRPKVPPAEDVLDLTIRSQLVEEKKEMEEFLNTLKSASLKMVDPKEMLHDMGPDLDMKVKEKVTSYLEQAELELS